VSTFFRTIQHRRNRKSFFLKTPIVPVENVVTLMTTIGCLSHAIRGTPRDTGRKSFFPKRGFRPNRHRNPNRCWRLTVPRISWDTAGHAVRERPHKQRACARWDAGLGHHGSVNETGRGSLKGSRKRPRHQPRIASLRCGPLATDDLEPRSWRPAHPVERREWLGRAIDSAR
jgi:hypothetical protein